MRNNEGCFRMHRTIRGEGAMRGSRCVVPLKSVGRKREGGEGRKECGLRWARGHRVVEHAADASEL